MKQTKSSNRKSNMKKWFIVATVLLLFGVGCFFTWKYIRSNHIPIDVEPSGSWEPFIETLDAEHESLFVTNDGLQLEADLFIPAGGSEQKAAIVFTPGSGDVLIQNYAAGFIEQNILELFLERDMAVLLMNKRGMGQSEGSHIQNSFQGRADDVYAGVQMLQAHPAIDSSQVGIVGHSQGGWVVTILAAQHPDVAFYIVLAGPTMTMYGNSYDNSYHVGMCNGLEGQKLENTVQRHMQGVDLGMLIGDLTNFGHFGFDARNMEYDPVDDLRTASQPSLLLYGEYDSLVTPSLNLEILDTIFEGDVPERISTYTISEANHLFHRVPDPCAPHSPNLSSEYVEVVNTWLNETVHSGQ